MFRVLLQVVKLLVEHGSDPNLPNEKEQTPLDVCPSEEIRQLLMGTTLASPNLQPATSSSGESHAVSSVTEQGHVEATESKAKVKQDLQSDETQEDSAFSPITEPVPLQSTHREHTTQQSTPGALETPTSQKPPPVTATPSRMRKRSKRERERGRVFSDVSSSESDSELLVTVRKVPRLVDRLPASVREEEGGGGGGGGDGSGGGGGGGGGEGEKGEEERDEGAEEKEKKEQEEVKEGEKVEQNDGAAAREVEEKEKGEEQSTDNVKLERNDEVEKPTIDDKLSGEQTEENGERTEENVSTGVVASGDTTTEVEEIPQKPAAGKEGETAEVVKEEIEAEKHTSQETERGWFLLCTSY